MPFYSYSWSLATFENTMILAHFMNIYQALLNNYWLSCGKVGKAQNHAFAYFPLCESPDFCDCRSSMLMCPPKTNRPSVLMASPLHLKCSSPTVSNGSSPRKFYEKDFSPDSFPEDSFILSTAPSLKTAANGWEMSASSPKHWRWPNLSSQI